MGRKWPGSSVCGISQARLLCSGLPFPFPEGLPDPGTELISPALAGGSFYHEPPGKPLQRLTYVYKLLELFTDGCALY